MAAAMSTAVGGGVTTAAPGLDPWSAQPILVTVAAITILGAAARKMVSVVALAAVLTAGVVVADSALGGHLQHSLDLSRVFLSTADSGT